MKIVVDMNHPGHVHFFKNFIWEMKKRGHKVLITAGQKDVAFKLLKNYDLDFVSLGGYGDTIIKKTLNIPVLTWRMYQAVKDFKPDLFVGIGSFRSAHISFLLGKKCLIFDDSEPALITQLMYLPFATKVLTPTCFRKKLGPKQVKYNGYHEIAYLHPDYFKSEKSIWKDLDLKPKSAYFVMRFVSWKAGHDIGRKGLTEQEKIKLVKLLSRYGKVLISSEAELPKKLEPYRFKIPVEKMHNTLYHATLFVGDSQTMATEAALLGTPTVRYNSFAGPDDMGNFIELEKDYGLMFSFNDFKQAFNKTKELLGMKELKEKWQKKRLKLFSDKIDVTAMMVKMVENYQKKPKKHS